MATAAKTGDRKRTFDRAEPFRNGPERLSKPKDIDRWLEPLLMQVLGRVMGLQDVVQNLARRLHHVEQQLEQREHRVMPGAPKPSSLPPDVVATSSDD